MQPLIFIVGSTATGKSEVSFLLAKELKAEVISCDSMLIYKETPLITSQPSPAWLDEIKHHFAAGTISLKASRNVDLAMDAFP